MTSSSLTSQLEAVNTLLQSIGESKVNSLDPTGLADVSAALGVLDEISRDVQTTGWQFNTESDYPLPRDTDGLISLPQNTLKTIVTSNSSLEVTQRGLKLYDKTNHRYTFTDDLKATIVFLLSWDELPQVARHYIMVRASRIFQARTLGSDSQFQFSADEERAAEKNLIEAEGETGSYNIFSGSYSVTSIMER